MSRAPALFEEMHYAWSSDRKGIQNRSVAASGATGPQFKEG
jgi:hypothetical protein